MTIGILGGVDLFDWTYETLTIYFDPNTDGENNDQRMPGDQDTGIDGYAVSINQPIGRSEIAPGRAPSASSISEAHVNALFGNQGQHSGFQGMVVQQTTSVDERFGYTEIFIPWEDFNASDPDIFDPELSDVGLYHPHPPFPDAQWFFNIGRVETSGNATAWTTVPGVEFFCRTTPWNIGLRPLYH